MNIIISDESNFKQLDRSRKILSKYFQQINSRTFIGHISQEGLIFLKQELAQITNRYTSIACFKVETRTRIELQWIIGNKNNFDTNGTYCFKQKNIQKVKNQKKEEQKQKMEQQSQKAMKRLNNLAFSDLLKNILEISALLHDIGKINTLFQNKIAQIGEKNFEPIRHEALSFLITIELLQNITQLNFEQFSNDNELIEIIANQIGNKNIWNDIFQDGKIHIKEKLTSKTEIETYFRKIGINLIGENYKKTPVIRSILWLILTHHRIYDSIPDSEGNNEYRLLEDKQSSVFLKNLDSPNYFNHLNLSHTWQSKDFSNNLSYSVSKDKNLFFYEEQWLQKLKSTFEQLSSNLNKVQAKENLSSEALSSILFFYLRPALMTADFLASNDKKDLKSIKSSPDLFLANSDLISRELVGDTLVSHLQTTASKTQAIHSILSNNSSFKYCNFKKNIFKAKNSLTLKFQWQAQAEEDILSQKWQNSSTPFFGIIISETGSGKTLAAPRIMNALSSQQRYTLALGFRSLTLQTGKSYEENLQLNKEDLAVIVGNDISKKLFALHNHEKTSNYESSGSESLDLTIEEEDYFVYSQNTQYSNWFSNLFQGIELEKANKIYPNNIKQIIEAPIVVCTIDYLIKITEQINYKDVFSLLRNFTADLVLDEIDNYSAKDLVGVAKLCYLQGITGKKLLIMSATISTVIAQTLFEAYKKGLDIYFTMKNVETPKMNIGLFSNLTHKNITNSLQQLSLNNTEILSNFNLEYKNFTNRFHEGLQLYGDKKNKLAIIPIRTGEKNHDNSFTDILEHCYEFHRQHNFSITQSNKKFSIGFVRFNNTKKAVAFSQFLLKNPSQNSLKNFIFSQCYHSRMPTTALQIIEENLNKHLNRKDETEFHKFLFEKTKHLQAENILLIVSTTSIQETGRDHDYDYSIVEPSTLRSLVQSAGRVRRHRSNNGIPIEKPNIGLLETPLYLDTTKYKWKNSGLENEGLILYTDKSSTQAKVEKELNNYFSELPPEYTYLKNLNPSLDNKIFSIQILNHFKDGYITTSSCLIEPAPTEQLKTFEYATHYKSLKYNKEKDCSSLPSFYNHRNKLFLSHAKQNKFRYNETINVEVSLIFNNTYPERYISNIEYSEKFKDINITNEDYSQYLIYSINEEELNKKGVELATKLNLNIKALEDIKPLFSVNLSIYGGRFNYKYKHHLGYYTE